MRKKSHISLARYIVGDIHMTELFAHRKAFYLGSILPDCKPSFLTTKHEFDGTFQMVQDRILKLTQDRAQLQENARAYMRQLGEVVHYIADYFTFPHNRTYDGNLKDHCVYEEDLKIGLRQYIRTGQADVDKVEAKHFDTAEALFEFIRKAHEEYLSVKRSVEEDCMYIVRVCQQVVRSVLQLLNINLNTVQSLA